MPRTAPSPRRSRSVSAHRFPEIPLPRIGSLLSFRARGENESLDLVRVYLVPSGDRHLPRALDASVRRPCWHRYPGTGGPDAARKIYHKRSGVAEGRAPGRGREPVEVAFPSGRTAASCVPSPRRRRRWPVQMSDRLSFQPDGTRGRAYVEQSDELGGHRPNRPATPRRGSPSASKIAAGRALRFSTSFSSAAVGWQTNPSQACTSTCAMIPRYGFREPPAPGGLAAFSPREGLAARLPDL